MGTGCEWKTKMVSEKCDFEGKGVDIGPLNQLGGIFVNTFSRISQVILTLSFDWPMGPFV